VTLFYPAKNHKDRKGGSLKLLHQVIISRLQTAIMKHYNDISYELAEASEFNLALRALQNEEEIAPGYTALILNPADVLWEKRLQQGVETLLPREKEEIIPTRVTARLSQHRQIISISI